ncbi:MAG: type II toxin-antitoxin system RelE/ParE family toxin [Coriobacteriaceae bacterium]|nr:type II toxin-antitoxin system RelE/ParE family toxin [Coriobacteriaceae bacterium]
MFSVVETDAAMEDMRETLAYLKYRTGGKQAGANLLDAYEKLIEVLENTPLAFPVVADQIVSSLGYRWARIRSYIVLYTVSESEGVVFIERIEHESRNWRALLG